MGVGGTEPGRGLLPQSHTRSLPDAFTSGVHPTGHKRFAFPRSFVWAPRNMCRVATPFKILHLDLAVSTFSCRTSYQAHFSAGPKCYCYLQSNQTAEGFYKQPRMKIHLPQSVYGFSRKRRAVCRGRSRFSGGNQCPPHWDMTFWCASGRRVHHGTQPTGSFIQHPPGLPESAPRAQKPALCPGCSFGLCRQVVGTGVSAPPGLPLQPPPGRVSFYRDVESVFGNSRHSNNLDFSFCTSRL